MVTAKDNLSCLKRDKLSLSPCPFLAISSANYCFQIRSYIDINEEKDGNCHKKGGGGMNPTKKLLPAIEYIYFKHIFIFCRKKTQFRNSRNGGQIIERNDLYI